MMYPLSVQRENDYLRRELGSEHGHQRYQWGWSEDIAMPMVTIDDEGQIQYDYHCGCGVNVTIHLASCQTLTIPKPKWDIQKLVPGLSNQWVMCRWLRPEMSRENWVATFNVPYPETGYLIPVGDLVKCIALNGDQVPTRVTTELVIRHIKEHFSVSAKERERETKDWWDERDAAKREDYRAKIKDAAPVGMGWPGEKNDFSAGGDQTLESPTLRRLTPNESVAVN